MHNNSDKKMFIGIDPSINSTGIVIRVCNTDGHEESVKYYILKGDQHKITKKKKQQVNPLSRAELSAQSVYDNFNYILYDKYVADGKVASVENEYCKTVSFISLTNKLLELIKTEYANAGFPEIYVVIEGISYGSTIKTSSVFDLAGLNYMIRSVMMNFTDKVIIAPPSHVKKFATGVGNANKELMITTFKAIHPELNIPKIDDVADAFFMSRLAQKFFEQNIFGKF